MELWNNASSNNILFDNKIINRTWYNIEIERIVGIYEYPNMVYMFMFNNVLMSELSIAEVYPNLFTFLYKNEAHNDDLICPLEIKR